MRLLVALLRVKDTTTAGRAQDRLGQPQPGSAGRPGKQRGCVRSELSLAERAEGGARPGRACRCGRSWRQH